MTTVENDSYDSWGKRRYPFGIPDPVGSITSQTTRGFTSQEEVADAGLVNLNGRIYDPVIGRMISADPTTYKPYSTQGWNRYSYVNNNPVNLTDPTGFYSCSDDSCSDPDPVSDPDAGGGENGFGGWTLRAIGFTSSAYFTSNVLTSTDLGLNSGSILSQGLGPLNLNIGSNDPGQLAGGQPVFWQGGNNNAAVSYGDGFLQNSNVTFSAPGLSADQNLGVTKFVNIADNSTAGQYLGNARGGARDCLGMCHGYTVDPNTPVVTPSPSMVAGGAALALGAAALCPLTACTADVALPFALAGGGALYVTVPTTAGVASGLGVTTSVMMMGKANNEAGGTPSDAQKAIRRDQGPDQIKRIDKPEESVPGSQWHAHDNYNGALNLDGSIHDNPPRFSQKTLQWLQRYGWSIPSKP